MTYVFESLFQPKLIVADDDPDIRSLLVSILRADGYEVEWEDSGAGLLSRLSRDDADPTLVVTDLRMPWLDGLEVLERAAQMGLQIPGILCTGYPDSEVRERARALHVPVLPKPVDVGELRREVSTRLSELDFWLEPEHDGYTEIRRRSSGS